MAEITLEALILEQNKRIPCLKYKPSPPGSFGFSYYFYEDEESYQCWLAKTKRYINIYYPNDKDVCEFEAISKKDETPEQQKKLVAILEALAALPTVVPQKQTEYKSERNYKKDALNVTIHNENTQSQSQKQSLAVELFIEAIKDDLTGRQIKELKTIVAEAGEDQEKARSGIISKLKEFGTNVASNIVANILTNPLIWSSL